MKILIEVAVVEAQDKKKRAYLGAVKAKFSTVLDVKPVVQNEELGNKKSYKN